MIIKIRDKDATPDLTVYLEEDDGGVVLMGVEPNGTTHELFSLVPDEDDCCYYVEEVTLEDLGFKEG